LNIFPPKKIYKKKIFSFSKEVMTTTNYTQYVNRNPSIIGPTGLPVPDNYYQAKQVTPEQFKYPVPRRGEDVTRVWKILHPDNPIYTSSTRIIRVKLPKQVLDFRRGYFLLDVTINVANPGTYKRLSLGSWSIFERMRWLNGTQIVEEFDHYNRIFSMLWVANQYPTVVDQIGQDLLGLGTQVQRNAWGAVKQRYAVPVALGIANCGVLPLHVLNDQFVELYIANPNEFVETDGTGAIDVQLSGIEWHVEHLMGGTIHQDLEALVMRGSSEGQGFVVQFDSWRKEESNTLSISNDIKISTRCDIFKAIVGYMFDGNSQTNPLANDKFYTWPKNNAGTYQFKINNTLYPEQSVECFGDGLRAYFMYLNWTNAWSLDTFSDDAPNISLQDFNTNSFLVIGDFFSNPNTNVLNNVSTSNMNPDVILKLQLQAPPPPGNKFASLINFTTIVKLTVKDNFFIRS
jgi:hypothetical protein